jgi:hypothetical protein
MLHLRTGKLEHFVLKQITITFPQVQGIPALIFLTNKAQVVFVFILLTLQVNLIVSQVKLILCD